MRNHDTGFQFVLLVGTLALSGTIGFIFTLFMAAILR